MSPLGEHHQQEMEQLTNWFFRFFNLPESFLGFNLKQTALDYLRRNPVKCYAAYVEARKILFGKEAQACRKKDRESLECTSPLMPSLNYIN